jgi:hypothetical protein
MGSHSNNEVASTTRTTSTTTKGHEMSWLYLDDQFADHPKVVKAGGDAAWLFVCILLYAKRYDTGGVIPAEQIPRLTDRKQPKRLIQRLIDAKLLEKVGENYEVHDWKDWNKSQQTRSEAGRKAANSRWSKRNGTDADASETHSERIPITDAETCPNPNPYPLPTIYSRELPNPQTGDNYSAVRQQVATIIGMSRKPAAIKAATLKRIDHELPQLLEQFEAPASVLASVILGEPSANLAHYKRTT